MYLLQTKLNIYNNSRDKLELDIIIIIIAIRIINNNVLYNLLMQTYKEFSRKYLSSLPVSWNSRHHQSTPIEPAGSLSELPYKLDWRKLGYVTPVSLFSPLRTFG